MIQINGEAVFNAAGKTLADYLTESGYQLTHIAVERNEEIVPKATYSQVRLEDGDRVEIVAFVGGG